MNKTLKIFIYIFIVIVMLLLVGLLAGKIINKDNVPVEEESEVIQEIEVYTQFKSDQGYELEYNPNRFATRSSEGYDYFIALQSPAEQDPTGFEMDEKKAETPEIFFASSMINSENVDAVQKAIFENDNESGDCILANGQLVGKYVSKNIDNEGEFYKSRVFFVKMSDGKAILIETQFPVEQNSIWEKRFDHMLQTLNVGGTVSTDIEETESSIIDETDESETQDGV